MSLLTFNKLALLLKSRSPYFFLVAVGFSVFVAELFVMIFFLLIPPLPGIVEAFLDSFLLSIIISPALYFFLYKPLKLENIEREAIEQELRKTADQLQLKTELLQGYSQTLEMKVADRTQELNNRNIELQELLEKLRITQLQMVQNEKMTSLGQLVAGIAHEINNPVSFIHGNLLHVQEYSHNLLNLIQLYQKYYPVPVPEIAREIEEIEVDFLCKDMPKLLSSMTIGTDRIRDIILSLRNFSCIDQSEFKTIDIHEGINSTLLILQSRLKATYNNSTEIEILRNYGNLPLIECYPGQLNQVFMNILMNAIEALETCQPKLSVQEILDHPKQIEIRTSVVNSHWLEISIADNGCGMPETIRQQVFNPFFTTKQIGKGIGIGMAISYQIITQKHEGTLECISTLGEGTKFVIQIPIKQPRLI